MADEKEELTPEQEADKAWTEFDALDAGEEAGTPSDEDQEEEDAEETPEDEEEPSASEESETEDEDEEAEPETAELQRRLSETQRWGHQLAQEVKELKQVLQEQQEGKATQEEVDAARKKMEGAQTKLDEVKSGVYEDHPELKPLVDPLLDIIEGLQKEVDSVSKGAAKSRQELEHEQALKEFERHVKPRVVEAHSDFDDIVKSDDYWQWAQKQRPALQTAAMNSPDPEDIIWAITEFKKSKAGGEIDAEKQRQAKQKAKRKSAARSPKPGATAHPSKEKGSKDMNPDQAWDYWDKEDKKKGTGKSKAMPHM